MRILLLTLLLVFKNGNTQSFENNILTSPTKSSWNSVDNIGETGVSNRDINDNMIINEATYFVVASRLCRPGQVYRVVVNVLQSFLPLTVRASIQRNGIEITADDKEVKDGIPEELLLKMPSRSLPGNYKLRVAGFYNGGKGGQVFLNETELDFSQRSMTIFIQTDKPVYMQGQNVRFRTIPINTELKAFNDPVDVYILDPLGRIARRWLSRQSNLGTVWLSYQLSDQPVFGEWSIEVRVQDQVEVKKFSVEEYYQTRFEVNVTMPAFFFSNEPFIHGIVQANYTSGAPVNGNLTLKATIKPLNKYRASHSQFSTIERNLVLYEEYPYWSKYTNIEYGSHVLRFFNGTYNFRYPMEDLKANLAIEDGVEVQITATVGERFLEEIIVGYSTARVFNSSIRVKFFGGSPQVFKPAMPFTLNLVASYHDGSKLRDSQLRNSEMRIQGRIVTETGTHRELSPRTLFMFSDKPGIWPAKIDLRQEFDSGYSSSRTQQTNWYADIKSMTVHATFTDGEGNRVESDLHLIAHESPKKKQIKVSTSTRDARVGDYLVLHVETNFYIDTFNYIIMSKGSVILSGQDIWVHNIRTLSIPLSPEIAPVATAVVYHVGKRGDVFVDTLTIPVNGISRNNFTVFINNKKARTGERVEVAIYGEPGTYVALSATDRAFFSMQAGNELTYAEVISKMAYFGEETNGTHSHSWLHHNGDPDDVVHMPSSTYGIDANRTFEFAGLLVFTDAHIYRRPSLCNYTQGYGECLTGQCYRLDKKCDGYLDCEDGTDEINCKIGNATDLQHFRKYRFNRIQRQYDNVWLWHNVNIGPHGRSVFNIEVPRRPAHWMITAFSMSPKRGFGMVTKAIEYTGVLPFFINVEMPTNSRQGEQIGIRVTVFNYLTHNIEVTVVLAGSPDYKFVHVEKGGQVKAYNPRTSFGEHQFFIWIAKQDAAVVYLPIVPTRLGDIKVKIEALSILGKDSVERMLHVEADGLPQLRHQSLLLDLSTRQYVPAYMHINITEEPYIPYTEDRFYVLDSNKARISVVGDVVGPIFPTMPVNATSLLGLPMDSAEQNMFSFAANMYTTLYMRSINQRDAKQEKNSFYHMNIGYQRQLSFLNPNGSFSLFRSDWNQSASSVWLTAFCARILQEATFYEWENYIYIDPKVIENAISWLLDYQTDRGEFYEITWLPDRKMNNSNIRDDDQYNLRYKHVSLTAHVLITLSKVRELAGELGTRVALRAREAMKWLEINLNRIKNEGSPYEMAITAYALMEAKSASAESAFNILSSRAIQDGDFMYWGRERVPLPPTKMENQKPFSLPRLPYAYDAENIETTAYALMTFVAKQDIRSINIVRWLNSQRLTDGGWASTQDTAWAMKALKEFTERGQIRSVSNLKLAIDPASSTESGAIFHIGDKNRAKLQTLNIPKAWGTVKVEATGSGYAILQMSVQYNVDLKRFQTQPPVRAFDLNVTSEFYGKNQSHIHYTTCQSWINVNESARSGMAILDVTIPTGYIIQQQVLDRYIRSREVRNLQRAKFLGDKVLFYFDYLDTEQSCVDFTVERWYPVANMSRFLPIRVYEYYAPERFNETIFDAVSVYALNICEVCGSSQCPYCPIYNVAILVGTPTSFLIILSVVSAAIRYFRTQEFSVG